MAKKDIDENLKEEVSPEVEKSYQERCHVKTETIEEINERNKKNIEQIKQWNAGINKISNGIPDSKLNLVLGPDK